MRKYPNHACQYCGSEMKLVETLIDDEFYWNETNQQYESNKFTNLFELTGNERCSYCEREWTGL